MAFLMTCQIMAQEVVVTGAVVDATDGSPLIGINVLVRGSSVGTITDVEGKFSLNVPEESKALVFSCIGYQEQEVALKSKQKMLNVSMHEDAELLDEVVVIGYGGANQCSSTNYKQLWRMTAEQLAVKGVNNVLYVYSLSSGLKDPCQDLERYPGDGLIDVWGYDAYQGDSLSFIKDMKSSLDVVGEVGKKHNKIIAITEVGYEGVPHAKWWTKTLLPLIENYPLSYVLVWRNARERPTHYYAPYPGQISAIDFVEFYNHPKTLFLSDIDSLYKNN